MKPTKTKAPRRSAAQAANKKIPRKFSFTVVIEKDDDGYFASCPALQGCYTDGDTYEEALKNIEEVVELHVEARLDAGEPIPANEMVSLATVEVSV
jgi:predicted RNase H-like HicB family nuclease